MTDHQLLERMLAGEEEAFLTLYRRRQGPVYRFAWHMSGSASIAEEVTQEVFLTLVRDGRRYDAARGTVESYLYGIARNHVLRTLERDRPYVALEAETSETLAAPDDPLAELTREERLEGLRQAVVSLPASYREVVVLCDLHEMDYAGAAEVLGCPVGTLRSRLHRARALLGEKLRGNPARCLV